MHALSSLMTSVTSLRGADIWSCVSSANSPLPLSELMLKYKIDECNPKISGELSTFNLNWLCYKPILTTDNPSVYVVILDLECMHM